MRVCVGGPVGAGQVEQKLSRQLGRRRGQVGVDSFLPAVRALRAQAQAFGGLEDRERLEVRGLEQDLGRARSDLGLFAAHDPGEGDRPLGVGDQEVVGLEPAVDAVERPQRLVWPRPADDDLATGECLEVECV